MMVALYLSRVPVSAVFLSRSTHLHDVVELGFEPLGDGLVLNLPVMGLFLSKL